MSAPHEQERPTRAEIVGESTPPPPIQSTLPPEWYDAVERYGTSARATIEAGRMLRRRAEVLQEAEREATRRSQEQIRLEYRRELDRLIRLISYDPDAVRQALGLDEWLISKQGMAGERP